MIKYLLHSKTANGFLAPRSDVAFACRSWTPHAEMGETVTAEQFEQMKAEWPFLAECTLIPFGKPEEADARVGKRHRITVDGVELTASIIPDVRFGTLNGTPIKVSRHRRGFYRWSLMRAGGCEYTEVYGRGSTCTEALQKARVRLNSLRSEDGRALGDGVDRLSTPAAISAGAAKPPGNKSGVTPMPKHSKFQRGETTYHCASCKRLTRNTGDNGQCELCPQCFQLAGIENEIDDGGATVEEVRARVEQLAEEVRQAGGVPDIAFLQDNS